MAKKALGRGLDALLAADDPPAPSPLLREAPVPPPPAEAASAGAASAEAAGAPAEGRLFHAPVDRLRPGVHQPRTDFDEEGLADLARSVARHGVIQPILVRRMAGGGYEIVAGERRWRAARLAGLAEVPALLVETAEEGALEMAIIENLQRSDLNPMEEAAAFASMMERFGLTQEEVAARVGKDRSTVANYVRLLRLPEAVQESVAAGLLSMGHARALLALRAEAEIAAFAEAAVKKGLSVRQLEARVRRSLAGASPKGAKYAGSSAGEGPTGPQALYLGEIAGRLRTALGTKVRIEGDERRGTILVEYYSRETLEGLIERLV